MRKNDAFVVKIVIKRLTKGFMAMFAPAESLPSPATLERDKTGKNAEQVMSHSWPPEAAVRYLNTWLPVVAFLL